MKMKIRPLEWEVDDSPRNHTVYRAKAGGYSVCVYTWSDGHVTWDITWDDMIVTQDDKATTLPEAQAAAEAAYQREISEHLEPDPDAPGILPGDPGGDDADVIFLIDAEVCALVYDERKNVDGEWEVEATITGVQLGDIWINRAMAMAINAGAVSERETYAANHRRDAKIDEEPRK